MEDYDVAVAEARKNPDFAMKSVDGQREAQKEALLQSLFTNEKFRSGPQAFQQAFVDDQMAQFEPVYEDPDAKIWMDQVSREYEAGNPQARDTLKAFYEETDIMDRMPVISGTVLSVQDPEEWYEYSGASPRYANSPMDMNRTRGADDNKARVEIDRLFRENEDTEMIEMLDSKRRDRIVMTAMIGEEVATALIAGGIGRAMGGAAKAASALQKSGHIGSYFANHLPGWAMEAGAEGLRGAANNVHMLTNRGEDPTIKGAAFAFGAHAAVDLAIGAVADGIFSAVGSARHGYNREVADELVKTYGDRVAKGTVDPNDITMPAGLDSEQFRALSSINMKNQSLAKMADGVTRPQDLTQLEQANLTAYRQSYYLTQSKDGTFLVQPKANPTKAMPFKSTVEAEEWMGTQGSKYYDALVEAGKDAEAEIFLKTNPQLNYKMARDADDSSWTIPDASDGFNQIPNRQYVSPVEMKDFIDKQTGQYVRFAHEPLTDAQLKKGRKLYTGNENLRVVEDPNGDAIFKFGGEGNVATPADLQLAEATAIQRMKDPSIGDTTLEAVIRDELIKKGKNSAIHPDGTVSILFPDKVKVSNRFVNPETGGFGTIGTTQKGFKPAISVKAGTNVADLATKPKAYAELGVRVLSGDVNANQVRRYTEGYLQSKGVKGKVRATVNKSGTVKVVKKPNGDISISVPASITDPKAQREVYAQLMRGMDEIGGVGGPKPASYTKAFNTQQKNYTQAFYGMNDFDAYAKSLDELPTVEGIAKQGEEYIFKSTKTGKVYRTIDPNIHLRDIAVNDMDSATFSASLRNAGYEVIETGDGLVVKSAKGGDILAEGVDHVELAKTLDFYPEKLPASMAPAMNFIDEVPGINLKATKQLASGTSAEVASFMGNFEDARKALGADVVVKKTNGDSMTKLGKANYEVKINGLGYTRRFDNAKDARKFLEGEWKTIESAQQAAIDKGLRMYYVDGKFHLKNDNLDLIAETVPELRAQIAKAPNPTYANEIFPTDVRKALYDMNIEMELPPGFGRLTQSATDMHPAPQDWKAFRDTTPGVLDKYLPKVSAIRRVAARVDARTGGKLGLAKNFERLQKNSRIALAKSDQDKNVLMKLFSENGKIISPDRRKGVTHYLESISKSAEVKDKVAKAWGLTDYDLNKVIPELKDFYLQKADELGIPFEKILSDYQPRMRKASKNFKEATDTNLLTKEFIDSSLDTKEFASQKGFGFYNLFERFDDVRKAWQEEDALNTALRYSNAGNRHYYAGKAWQDIYDTLATNGKEIQGDGLIPLLNSYKDALTHPQNAFHKSSVVKSMNNLTKRLGMTGADATAFTDVLMSLPYSTSMAFRPWMPFRNAFQIFTILPLRTGNIHTSVKAASQFIKNPKKTLDAMMNDMLLEGVIPKRGGAQSNVYLDMMKGNLEATKGPVRQFYEAAMEFGLKGYALSDDFTRAVAYTASNDMFAKGIRKATRNGEIDIDAFMKASRSDGLMPGIREQIVDFMKQDNLEGARTTMARANIDATMFDYSAMNKPLGASGTMGHLFYQFGTYSLNYVQTVATAFSQGSISNKVGGAVAMAAGMFAVSEGMKRSGVENSSFLGYNMALFNGGPFFQMAQNTLGAMDQGISGDMARRDLMRNIGLKPTKDGIGLTYPALIPGGLHAKYIAKSVGYLKEGDYWGAWLAATTTPEHKSRTE